MVAPKANGGNDIDDLFTRGQFRMSEALVKRYGRKVMYVPGLGWYLWDKKRWRRDDLGRIYEVGKKVIRGEIERAVDLRSRAKDLQAQSDTTANEALKIKLDAEADELAEYAKQLEKDAFSCQTSAGLEGIIKLARTNSEIAADAKDLNADPYLFNLQNGTLNIESGVLGKHDPTHRITYVANARYDLKAVGTQWQSHLKTVIPNNALREFVQVLFGLALVGAQPEHLLPILYGNGSNGKGALIIGISHAFGDYAITGARDLFTSKPDAHPTAEADLAGSRFVSINEIEQGTRLSEALVKDATGGGIHKARHMSKDFFQFKRTWLAVMVTNHLPTVAGIDKGIWRRLLVVPFTHTFDDDSALKLHGEEVLTRESDAIFMWLYEGWRKYMAAGRKLAIPNQVKDATLQYRHDNDKIQLWLDDRCERGTGDLYTAKLADLHTAYMNWRTDYPDAPEFSGPRIFLNALRERSIHYDRKAARVVGLRLAARRKQGVTSGYGDEVDEAT